MILLVVVLCQKCVPSFTEELPGVLPTSDHEKTDDVIATRVAQPRLCHSGAHLQVDRACQHDLLCANLNHSTWSAPWPPTKSSSTSNRIISIRLVKLVQHACNIVVFVPLLSRWVLPPGKLIIF